MGIDVQTVTVSPGIVAVLYTTPSMVALAENVKVAVPLAGNVGMVHNPTGFPGAYVPTDVDADPGTTANPVLIESRTITFEAAPAPVLASTTV